MAKKTPNEPKRWKEVLPVKLTQDEIQERAELMAARVQEHKAEEVKIKDAAKKEKERVEAIGGQIYQLSQVVRSGHEPRDVEVTEEFDLDRNVALVVRQDSFQIVRERNLTADEISDAKQGKLFEVKRQARAAGVEA